jgi:hypothetical protein
MKRFTLINGFKVAEVEIVLMDTIGDSCDTITVRLVDEGAGHFVQIETEGKVAIDADALVQLAKACSGMCAELDALMDNAK